VSVLVASGAPLQELRVAGGGARVPALGQIKADALARPVRHLAHDSAPVGVALLAASRTGYADEVRAAAAANLGRARVFKPQPVSAAAIRERYAWFVDVRASEAVRLRTCG
jgi:sugar (pentulose or hexulose) kinase